MGVWREGGKQALCSGPIWPLNAWLLFKPQYVYTRSAKPHCLSLGLWGKSPLVQRMFKALAEMPGQTGRTICREGSATRGGGVRGMGNNKSQAEDPGVLAAPRCPLCPPPPGAPCRPAH